MNWCALFNISIVFLFGLFASFIELLLRYKEWKYIFFCSKRTERVEEESVVGYVFLYIFLNGIVSIFAFWLIKFFQNESISNISSLETQNLIIAGFGGMMILRSSIFSIKQNNKDVEIGFASVVQALIDIIDRKINHNIAARRICDIHELMEEIDFESAKAELPALCIEFIDYFTDEDSKNLRDKITEIDKNNDLSNVNKSLQLGREIVKYCDRELLKRVIKKLPHIKIKPQNEKTKDEFESLKEKLNS